MGLCCLTFLVLMQTAMLEQEFRQWAKGKRSGGGGRGGGEEDRNVGEPF